HRDGDSLDHLGSRQGSEHGDDARRAQCDRLFDVPREALAARRLCALQHRGELSGDASRRYRARGPRDDPEEPLHRRAAAADRRGLIMLPPPCGGRICTYIAALYYNVNYGNGSNEKLLIDTA